MNVIAPECYSPGIELLATAFEDVPIVDFYIKDDKGLFI